MSNPLSRRALIASATAATASPALGQGTTEDLPPCFASKSFGVWRARSSTGGPVLSPRTEIVTGDDTRRFGAYVSADATEPQLFVQGLEVSFASLGKPQIDLFEVDDALRMTFRFGRADDDLIKERIEAAIKDTGVTVVLMADDTEIGRFDDIRFSFHSFTVNRDVLMDLVGRYTTLTITTYIGTEATGNLLSTQSYPFAGLPEALAAVEGVHSEHLAAIRAAGDCKSGGCAMTTASVGLLGRSDDCFELTQMRRLRAAFPEHRVVVEDYLTASARLLARPGPRLTISLLTFYALIVWPTALLVRAGFRKPAGYLYLAGFGLLKRAMGLPRVPGRA